MVTRDPLVASVSSAETALFQTDMETIKKCEIRENFIWSPLHSRGPSPLHAFSSRPATPVELTTLQRDTIASSPIHPEFLDRPGSLEVLEVGARLRNRYRKLKYSSCRRKEELSRLLQTVVEYESECGTFSKWLDEMASRLKKHGPLIISCEELKTELQRATVRKNHLHTSLPILISCIIILLLTGYAERNDK